MRTKTKLVTVGVSVVLAAGAMIAGTTMQANADETPRSNSAKVSAPQAAAAGDVHTMTNQVPCSNRPDYLLLQAPSVRKCFANAGVTYLDVKNPQVIYTGNNWGWVEVSGKSVGLGHKMYFERNQKLKFPKNVLLTALIIQPVPGDND